MTRRPKYSINTDDFKVKDYHTHKFQKEEGFKYIARDKNNGHVINDYMNNGGFLTSWIKKNYGVEVPSLYERRLYYQMNGDYWWEQWFDIVKVPIEEAPIVCPYCGWKCKDKVNHSGAYTAHLRDVHNVDFKEHLEQFLQDKKFLSKQVTILHKEELKSNDENYVVCPICNEKLLKMTPSHLKYRHGMTMDEFKIKFPDSQVMSKLMHEQVCETAKLANLKTRKKKFSSSYEKSIQDMLSSYNVEFSSNRQILIGKEIDILMPSYNLGIEFDGLLFHSVKFGKKDKYYHLNKTMQCNEKGYGLIHVFEDEMHFKKDITLNRIKHKLNLNNDLPKIDGRKCIVKPIDIEIAKDFIDKYDLSSWKGGNYGLGAFYLDELVGVLLVKEEEKLITHLMTQPNFICRGVSSKLIKTYIMHRKPTEIFAYGDKRWVCNGDDNLFIKIGFERIEDIDPKPWFYFSKKFRYSRFPTKIIDDADYDMVYDCGYFKYKLTVDEKI